MPDNQDLFVNTLNIMTAKGDVEGFEALAVRPNQTALSKIKTEPLSELAPVEIDTPFSIVTDSFLPISVSTLAYLPASTESDYRTVVPPMSYDAWRRFDKQVTRRGSAMLHEDDTRVWISTTETKCKLSVRCHTKIFVVMSMKGKGSTEYVADAAVSRGVTGGSLGVKTITVTLNILIKVDRSAADKNWIEENDVVRKERQNAGKQVKFKELPLDFMLLHEIMHRDDICEALTKIASSALSCDFSAADEQAMQSALNKKWQEILKKGHDGGVESATEEDVRRRVWDAWDKR